MKHRFFLSALIILSTCVFSFAGNSLDSIPLLNPAYKGFRLAVTNLTATKSEGWVNLKFTAINTGKEDIQFGKKVTFPSLIINIDESNSQELSKEIKSSFKQELFNSSIKIKAGQILLNCALRIKSSNLDNASLAIIKSDHSQAKSVDSGKNSLSTTSALTKGFSETKIDDSKCADLIIESVSIVKKSKNTITLKYKIKNQGKKSASITGSSKNQEDNLAMAFHMSSSEKLTRGAIPVGGTFVKKGIQIPDGKLYPGKSLTDEVKLDIRSMTRFTPIIILELDPYLLVQECNETNNLNHIKVKK